MDTRGIEVPLDRPESPLTRRIETRGDAELAEHRERVGPRQQGKGPPMLAVRAHSFPLRSDTSPNVYRPSRSSNAQCPVFISIVTSAKEPPSSTASRQGALPLAASADRGNTTPTAPPSRTRCQNRQQKAL